MNNREVLEKLDKDELIGLIDIYAKNWLALDGVWFQSIESRLGMDEAMYYDRAAWERYTAIEARRIKAFLGLPERPGLEGLAKALSLRLYAALNRGEILLEGNALTYRVLDCRVQTARRRKGMCFHPCRSVGLVEYSGFARTIDERISCQCLSCHPEVSDETCACAWRFTLEE